MQIGYLKFQEGFSTPVPRLLALNFIVGNLQILCSVCCQEFVFAEFRNAVGLTGVSYSQLSLSSLDESKKLAALE